jgi:hypothetical protein
MLSSRYIKLLRAVLSMVLDEAVRWRMIDANVVKFEPRYQLQSDFIEMELYPIGTVKSEVPL